MAPVEKVTSLKQWSKRETKQSFPMLFCGLEGGQEEQEEDSPSYFNRQEASTILVLIADLLESMKGNLLQEEIGLISPFYKQTQKLRMLLRARGLGKVRVGSTEEFHGHEVRALFISTVRTSVELLEHDSIFDTGFVGNVKRFNTALSRAVALVVVVGDATVLSNAPEWRELIAYCRDNGSFLNLTAPTVPTATSVPVEPPVSAPTPVPTQAPMSNGAVDGPEMAGDQTLPGGLVNGSADGVASNGHSVAAGHDLANAAQGKAGRGRIKRAGGRGSVNAPIDEVILQTTEIASADTERLSQEPSSPIPEWAQVRRRGTLGLTSTLSLRTTCKGLISVLPPVLVGADVAPSTRGFAPSIALGQD